MIYIYIGFVAFISGFFTRWFITSGGFGSSHANKLARTILRDHRKYFFSSGYFHVNMDGLYQNCGRWTDNRGLPVSAFQKPFLDYYRKKYVAQHREVMARIMKT